MDIKPNIDKHAIVLKMVILALIVSFSSLSIQPLAPKPVFAEVSKADRIQTLCLAIGRLQESRDAVEFWAKRIKGQHPAPMVMNRSHLLYEETRLAFNAWVDAVLSDFSARKNFRETAEYKTLTESANTKAMRFLDYARKNDGFKLTSNAMNNVAKLAGPEPLELLQGASISGDINKLMDQIGVALSRLGEGFLDGINYWTLRTKIEGLRLQSFENLKSPELIVMVVPSQEELKALSQAPTDTKALAALAKLKLLDAKFSIAAGRIDSGIRRYGKGFEILVKNARRGEQPTQFDEQYVQDFVSTLSSVDATAELKAVNADLIWLRERSKQ